MNKKLYVVVGLLLGSFFLFLHSGLSNNVNKENIPNTRQGKPWRIAYCESSEFVNYTATLQALVQGLSELGWIDAKGLPYSRGQKEAKPMWEWLAKHCNGPYVEFVPDAFYSFEKLTEKERNNVAHTLIQRLNERQDIDLVLVMGTQAGQLLANDQHHVPMMVFSSSNAVQAGIVRSVEDSGREHVWAHMEPARYQRQLEIFHDLFAFKKLGMVYEDSAEGHLYAALDDVKKVAAERGFQIESVNVKDKQNNRETHRRDMRIAYQILADKGVDAVYSSLYVDRDVTELAELFQPLYEKKIPIFAQMGAAEVRNGALLSVYRADFSGFGRFAANLVARIFHGETPRSLPQVFENTPSIVLNLEVAEKIDYRPPFEVLLVSDEIYQRIEKKK